MAFLILIDKIPKIKYNTPLFTDSELIITTNLFINSFYQRVYTLNSKLTKIELPQNDNMLPKKDDRKSKKKKKPEPIKPDKMTIYVPYIK